MIDRDAHITPHFRWREFIRDCDPDPRQDVLDNIQRLARKLETVRLCLGGRVITITSGYRTPEHNAEVGGATNSQHLHGCAADFVVSGMPPRRVQAIMGPSWDGGMGSYETWTHLDIGPRRRWHG